jgi:hypothetical protein
MMQQVYLDTAYADATLADGTHVFALRDPITVPEPPPRCMSAC